jgi:(p)ppGpp synthase/HD superfamily hydrolase
VTIEDNVFYEDVSLSDQVARARLFASVAHWPQTDKSGQPYYTDHLQHTIAMFEQRARLYPGEVASNLDEYDAKITKIALYLHDSLEDTPVTRGMLLTLGFPVRAVSVVDLLTRRKKVPKHLYYSRIAKEPEARFAKAADMDSNTHPTRIRRLAPEDQVRLLEKYIDGFARLELTPLHHLERELERAKGLLEGVSQ